MWSKYICSNSWSQLLTRFVSRWYNAVGITRLATSATLANVSNVSEGTNWQPLEGGDDQNNSGVLTWMQQKAIAPLTKRRPVKPFAGMPQQSCRFGNGDISCLGSHWQSTHSVVYMMWERTRGGDLNVCIWIWVTPGGPVRQTQCAPGAIVSRWRDFNQIHSIFFVLSSDVSVKSIKCLQMMFGWGCAARPHPAPSLCFMQWPSRQPQNASLRGSVGSRKSLSGAASFGKICEPLWHVIISSFHSLRKSLLLPLCFSFFYSPFKIDSTLSKKPDD